MIWKRLLLGLVVVAACVVGTTHAQSLDPTVIEAAIEASLGDGRTAVYLDAGKYGNTYVGIAHDLTFFNRGWDGLWTYQPQEIETQGINIPAITVDGDANGIGDSWYNDIDHEVTAPIRMVIYGDRNSTYDMWLVGVGANDGIQNYGLEWEDALGTVADRWDNIATASGSVRITNTAGATFDSYAVPASSRVFINHTDGTGKHLNYVYFDDPNFNQPNCDIGWFDGVVLVRKELGLDPATIEAAVGDGTGTFMDVSKGAYTRDGITGTTTGEWAVYGEADIEAHPEWGVDAISSDGDDNGRGDSWKITSGHASTEIMFEITGLTANGVYDLWGVGLDTDTLACGFKLGTASGVYTESWVDFSTEATGVEIADNGTLNTWSSWAAKSSSTFIADGSGVLTLYFADTAHADGGFASQLDGIVLQEIPVVYIPGDANFDGKVNATDATTLAEHWQSAGSWTDGDFNGDGVVNDIDATIMATNWGYGMVATVPEPSTLVLLLGMSLLFVLRRKR